ncbi:hypothetical protein [Inediibacterium massiliense]|uniref:hypothetical protein n=1 Tax=Inediibacterium massiliense TaxID=1658111 RepID=UPI0006B4BCE6|nr:hypothetical protein [Inediibacterium massiliense]
MKLEGFFSNIKNANHAIEQLKQSGFENPYLDLNDSYNENQNIRRNIPGTENASSLSNLVLGSGTNIVTDRNKASLAAASPMVSGMGRINEISDINCKIVVEVNNNNIENAKKIIKDRDGTIDNPHVDTPKIADDLDIETAFRILSNRFDDGIF